MFRRYPSQRTPNPAGFTLVELLIVIAIIALLAAILFPIFGAAKAASRRTACISNLRQIGIALGMYRQDYEELPPRLSTLFSTQISDARLLVCPNDPHQGHYLGNSRMEGTLWLPSGVSYDYIPQWQTAQEFGWWEAGPPFGPGKWGDMTPVTECQWHWAKKFHADWTENAKNVKGWQLVLMMAGSVRKLRVEDSLSNFSPDKYH